LACRTVRERAGTCVVATVFWGVVVVTVAVALALAGLILARRVVPFPVREAHNANTATMFGALYVIYGLMVGFSAYQVAAQFDAAQRTAQNEAGSVGEIYLLAEQLPEPDRHEIQGLAESYARAVVQEGWPKMEEGSASARTQKIGDELRRSVMGFEPGTGAEQALYAQGLTLAQDFDEYRALRLLEVREGIPPILWVVLILGGILTIGFTYLFGMKERWLHVLMVVALTVLLVMVLYTIRALEYPFDGIVQVEPEPFRILLEKIETGRVR
jgi:hypothetical protein